MIVKSSFFWNEQNGSSNKIVFKKSWSLDFTFKTSNDVTDVNKRGQFRQCSAVAKKNEDVKKDLNMDNFLKTSLSLRNVQATNQFSGGCINQGQTFIVDDNNKIYVKQNSNIVSIFFR